MVRTYKRKTERSNISEETVKSAIIDIIKDNKNIRQTAKKYGLSTSMLHKRISLLKRKQNNNTNYNDRDEDFSKTSLNVVGRKKFNSRQIFSDEEEKMLCHYLIEASEIHSGLTNIQARKLAYEFSLKLGKIIPQSWINNKTAGKEWILSFTKRNPQWHMPESTYLAKSLSFNKTAMKQSNDNYDSATQDRILNSHENGIATVLQTPKVISPKSKIESGQIEPIEVGEVVTMCIPHIKYEIVEYPESEPTDQSLDYSSTQEKSSEIIESTENTLKKSSRTFESLLKSGKDDPRIQKVYEFSHQSIEHDGSTTIFSQYLAEKLNQFDPRTKSILIHKINELIFEAEMNKYSNHSQIPSHPTASSPLLFPYKPTSPPN